MDANLWDTCDSQNAMIFQVLLIVSFPWYAQQTRFAEMGNRINGKMEELSQRMDQLEQHLGELMDEAGIDRESVGATRYQQSVTGTLTAASVTNASENMNSPKSPSRSVKPKTTSTQIEI